MCVVGRLYGRALEISARTRCCIWLIVILGELRMSINIVVCIKQIIDPEIPPEQFRVDPASKRQIRGGLSLVISPYDQNALEVALQLKEKLGGNITAL